MIGFSGFVPTVDGWQLDATRPFPPIAVGHGTYDPVIPIEFAHRSVAQLEAAGAEVLYRESPIDHAIDPAFVGGARAVDRRGGQSARRSVRVFPSARNCSNPWLMNRASSGSPRSTETDTAS